MERSIIATLCYFDVFDYPLTLMEIWKWLFSKGNGEKCGLSDIKETIENNQTMSEKVELYEGFYFLKGRRSIVKTRRHRYQLAEKKMKKAMRVARVLRYLPFVKMIAICNNLSYNNAREPSDIDFFIIVSHGRLWQTRFFISAVTHLMKMRRYNDLICNRICLSFYITDNHLDLEHLMITPVDPYFIYWFGQLVPIYNNHEYFSELASTNKWINKYLPNLVLNDPAQRRKVEDTKWSLLIKKIQETILTGVLGKYLEKNLKTVQKRKMVRNKESKLWEQSTAVMIDDDILKFHENDRRKQYAEQFSNKLKDELIQS